ncbi:MAG TPA: hydroxyacylglutathione hydrolase, partial [Caulobacteraceae bacterium]|nr:hydroxyacylglutathione hydrolase [Caulobacteraceae bacterium]
MPLIVRQFPCLSDNYGFLARDEATGVTACIDTPDAAAILREVAAFGGRLDFILNTHWHPDHAGGNEEVKAATGAAVVGPKEVERIAKLDRLVGEGDVVVLGQTRLNVIDTGGHTLQHITYYDAEDRIAFVGDTIFALGCGRLFEGDAEQMWTSLQKLAALPEDTTVYCAHEYTASNARFALSVDSSQALRSRADEVFAARDRDEPTVPTTIALEKATNPFLRAPQLRPNLAPAQA